jgi:hypothetical protein
MSLKGTKGDELLKLGTVCAESYKGWGRLTEATHFIFRRGVCSLPSAKLLSLKFHTYAKQGHNHPCV